MGLLKAAMTKPGKGVEGVTGRGQGTEESACGMFGCWSLGGCIWKGRKSNGEFLWEAHRDHTRRVMLRTLSWDGLDCVGRFVFWRHQCGHSAT